MNGPLWENEGASSDQGGCRKRSVWALGPNPDPSIPYTLLRYEAERKRELCFSPTIAVKCKLQLHHCASSHHQLRMWTCFFHNPATPNIAFINSQTFMALHLGFSDSTSIHVSSYSALLQLHRPRFILFGIVSSSSLTFTSIPHWFKDSKVCVAKSIHTVIICQTEKKRYRRHFRGLTGFNRYRTFLFDSWLIFLLLLLQFDFDVLRIWAILKVVNHCKNDWRFVPLRCYDLYEWIMVEEIFWILLLRVECTKNGVKKFVWTTVDSSLWWM